MARKSEARYNELTKNLEIWVEERLIVNERLTEGLSRSLAKLINAAYDRGFYDGVEYERSNKTKPH